MLQYKICMKGIYMKKFLFLILTLIWIVVSSFVIKNTYAKYVTRSYIKHRSKNCFLEYKSK